MGEVILMYFQCKKGPFWEEVLFHPLCGIYLGQRIIVLVVRLHPKGSRLADPAPKLLGTLKGDVKPLKFLELKAKEWSSSPWSRAAPKKELGRRDTKITHMKS